MKFKDIMLTLLVIIAIIDLYFTVATFTMLNDMGNRYSSTKTPKTITTQEYKLLQNSENQP